MAVVSRLLKQREVDAMSIIQESDVNVYRVLNHLVDRSDQKRVLEILSSPHRISQGLHSSARVSAVFGSIRNLKSNSKRNLAQAETILNTAMTLQLSVHEIVIIVMALNVAMCLNNENDDISDSKYRFVSQCLSQVTPLIEDDAKTTIRKAKQSLHRLIDKYSACDHTLRVRSSLLQRPRNQSKYPQSLVGIALVDAFVRDKRLELMLLFLLEYHGHELLINSTNKETLSARWRDVLKQCTSSSHDQIRPFVYSYAAAYFDELLCPEASIHSKALQDKEEDDDDDEGVCSYHPHHEALVAFASGSHYSTSSGTNMAPIQLVGSDWTTARNGKLLQKYLDNIHSKEQQHLLKYLVSVSQKSIDDDHNKDDDGDGDNRRNVVVVCGDGDLSYSMALSQRLHAQDDIDQLDPNAARLVATVYESEATLVSRYAHGHSNIEQIRHCADNRVYFGVDCTSLVKHQDLVTYVTDACMHFSHSSQHQDLVNLNFIFNFPFADVDAARKASLPFSTRYVAVERHQDLLQGFFNAIKQLNAEINVSTGVSTMSVRPRVLITLLAQQAIAWDIEYVASQCDFTLIDVFPFVVHKGYNRRRSYKDDCFREEGKAGYNVGIHEGSTFVFEM